MRITDLNLYTAYNKAEDFCVLVVADDEDDAKRIAKGYGKDSGFASNEWTIAHLSSYSSLDTIHFDCDYVIFDD